MAAHEKLLAKMRRSLSGWGQDDLKRLYEGFGFVCRQGSSHAFYSHPRHPQLTASVGRHNSLAVGYAETAIKIIDQLLAFEEQEKKEEEKKQDDAQNPPAKNLVTPPSKHPSKATSKSQRQKAKPSLRKQGER